MKIVALETRRIAERPNLLWLEIHADTGHVGLGETFFNAESVEAYLHEAIAPFLLGRDPLEIERIRRALQPYVGFAAPGVEMRALSALDIALWDLFGRTVDRSLTQLLGGAVRERIRTYNTCAGPDYIRRADGQKSDNFGLDGTGPHDDLAAFLHRADDLAESLLAEGITAMKIWPFDVAAEATAGQLITPSALRAALEPFDRIRTRVGDRMTIMVELHSLWQLDPAIRIARALEPFDTFWHEDPIRMDNMADVRRYAEASPAPVCASETLGGRHAFRDLLCDGGVGVVMFDLGWCGGVSEARRIAELADTWHRPVAPHDCTGPIVYGASVQLALALPNAIYQESVRAFYRGWYRDAVEALPDVTDGMIAAVPGAGHGMRLHEDFDRRFAVRRRRSGHP